MRFRTRALRRWNTAESEARFDTGDRVRFLLLEVEIGPPISRIFTPKIELALA